MIHTSEATPCRGRSHRADPSSGTRLHAGRDIPDALACRRSYRGGMRHLLGTVCVGLAALLLSGCDAGSLTDHHVTKQAYIARADAICARVDRADKAIPIDTPLSAVMRKTTEGLS